MNANRMRMAFGVYLVTALFTIPTVYAKPPIKELESRVAELEATAVVVQAELDSINATISQIQTDLAGHEARITTNESDINANSTLIDDNSKRIDALPKTLVVLDSNDKQVGAGMSRNRVDAADVFFSLNDRLIFLNITKERFVQGPVYYDQSNCLGTPHVGVNPEWMAELGSVRGTSVFLPIPNTTPPPILRSEWRRDTGFEDGICVNTTRTSDTDIFPAEVIFDISEFTPPFRYSVAP